MDEQIIGAVRRGRVVTGDNSWTGYLLAVAATCLVLLAAYSAVLAGLHRTGRLPPPAIINELCGDEKLAWLRETPPRDPNLLVVGSSLAWRNIDSEQFVLRNPAARPLNGGFCHTQINQAGFVTEYLLRHLPSVRTVVAIVGPQDMVDCARTPRQLFDPRTADEYAFERRWAYPFYVSHFDPVSLARNAGVIQTLREGRHTGNPLAMTRYGDGPIGVDGDPHLGLQYGGLAPYDPACFASLRSTAEAVASSGRSFFVAGNPVNPKWSALFDKDGRQDELVARVRSALRGTGARFWDGHSAFAGKPSDFTDAIHLNWAAAHRFTAMLADALENDQDRL